MFVRHCLDVMHIEKNVCNSIIGILLNIPDKTKYGVKSRLDLVEMGIREQLTPEQKGKNMYLLSVCYSLSRKEKINFINVLLGLRSQAISHQIFEVSC